MASFRDWPMKTSGKCLGRGLLMAATMMLLALGAALPAQVAGQARASVLAHTGPAGPASRTSRSAGPDDVAVLDVVMLVDESGSETPAKVADERQTAGTIAQTMLSPRSRVTVIGFGGVNHDAPNQNPIDVACQPTIASGTSNLSYLSSCVGKLHRRTDAEGNDTDYAAAFGQAMSYFNPGTTAGQQSPAGAIKVILMMTDGGVDVSHNTQQYGPNWRLGEQQAVSQQLAQARQDSVQVWPLGFGTDITSADASYLNQLAKDGAQTGCDTRQESRPHYNVVNNPADALSALDQLYANAGCVGQSVAPPISIGGNATSGALHVTLPAIASDAAISVDRGSPGIQVSFYQPDGQLWTDSSAVSGQDSPVEVLHVASLTSKDAGTWRIQLTAPAGLSSQLVSATAFWQGAVRALITANPPSASLGQQIHVTLSVLGPDGPITDPSTLSNLQVQVHVSGDGLSTTPVPVTGANGAASGTPTVGQYQGTFQAPRRSGSLTFTGTAAGYGLYATQVPATVAVGASNSFVATVQFPIVTSAQVGDSIRGQLNPVNRSGSAQSVRLELSTSHAVATINPAGAVTVPAGSSATVPFTITFSKGTPVGPAWLEVKAVNAANPGAAYNDATLNLTVTTPPGILARFKWVIIGAVAAILLAVLAGLWMRAAHRRKVDVRGLVAMLRRDGESLGAELKAPSKWAETFRFVIRDEDEATARLDYPQPGFSVFTVRRAGPGEIKLVTPAGDRYDDVVVGGPAVHLEDTGLELAFRDTRSRRGSVMPRPGGGTRRRAPARPGPRSTEQVADQTETLTPSAASEPRDEWL